MLCVCFSVGPLLYKFELWFKDFVAPYYWPISEVFYVDGIMRVDMGQGVFSLCVCVCVCLNDRRRMRGGDGTLLEDRRSSTSLSNFSFWSHRPV